MSQANKEPRFILAPNPSPLTGPGTNTNLIGQDHVAVIDPGPDDLSHLEMIMQAGNGKISHIFITHAHRDHSAGARKLGDMVGAPVLAFGDALAGRSPIMARLATSGLVGGGEGLDLEFQPDITLRDGEVVETPDWSLKALHTPGHCGNHLCFQWDDVMFCGDIVLGWSSTLISPPDGDLMDYFRSLEKILSASPQRLFPAHGDPVDDPTARIAELATHRRVRTAQILLELTKEPGDAANLANRIYDIPPHLMPAAARNTLAHLVALAELGAIRCQGEIAADAIFEMA